MQIRAKFHRAAIKQKNLFSMFALIKTGLPSKFSRDFQDKQTTAEYQTNKQYATNENLVGNPVFTKE